MQDQLVRVAVSNPYFVCSEQAEAIGAVCVGVSGAFAVHVHRCGWLRVRLYVYCICVCLCVCLLGLSLAPAWTWECGAAMASPLSDYQIYQMYPLHYKVLTLYEQYFHLIATKEFLIYL